MITHRRPLRRKPGSAQKHQGAGDFAVSINQYKAKIGDIAGATMPFVDGEADIKMRPAPGRENRAAMALHISFAAGSRRGAFQNLSGLILMRPGRKFIC
jgi:hypothetical protein